MPVAGQEEKPELPAEVVGRWEGTAHWAGGETPIEIELWGTGSDTDGEIVYHFQGFDCIGELLVRSAAIVWRRNASNNVMYGPQFQLDEIPGTGRRGDPDSCDAIGTINLTMQPDGALAFEANLEWAWEGVGIIWEDDALKPPQTLTATLKRPLCDWSGKWSTNWGPMELHQLSGPDITGNYEHDEGQIRGTVTGNVLSGTWTEVPSRQPPQDAGEFELTMAGDCNSFTGTWRYDASGEMAGSWDGQRKE
jgi:hypothetical protein